MSVWVHEHSRTLGNAQSYNQSPELTYTLMLEILTYEWNGVYNMN